MEFSLNAFTEFSEFSDKILYFLKKIPVLEPIILCEARTHSLLCKRQRLYHCTTDTQLTEKTVKLILIHASVIFEILWIRWIQWKFRSI